jgi:cell division protein FtsZ
MSTGYGEGDGRVKQAIDDALNSPLLNDNDVFNSKKILLSFTHSDDVNHKGLMMDEMNEINDFMEKFSNFELKWGIANDPTLGDKVKVTILATGFGLADIDEALAERQQKRTAEDMARLAEKEERERLERERMERYYGADGSNRPAKRRANCFLFKAEDLDNEDLILAVENNTTFGRTRQQLENLNHLSVSARKSASAEAPSSSPASPSAPTEGVISFA